MYTMDIPLDTVREIFHNISDTRAYIARGQCAKSATCGTLRVVLNIDGTRKTTPWSIVFVPQLRNHGRKN